MMQIGPYTISDRNGSKIAPPSVTVKRGKVILAKIVFDASKRASSPLSYIRNKHFIESYAMEQRLKLVEMLKRADVPEDHIKSILEG